MSLTILRDGHAYCSKVALERVRGLNTAAEPHITPDGRAVLACDISGPVLVVLADHGHDLMHLAKDESGSPAIRRVELAPEDLPDLEPLREYDHLPESRKDYETYPRGHQLA